MFETIWNVLQIFFGFGALIFLHELGHFVAARWAGVRVHAFAMGFGPALCSWRRGMGFCRGSTEDAYHAKRGGHDKSEPEGVSPTEYRLNVFPFGGYVKMLGQEDGTPAATSDATDSFTSVAVWKRMVIISAGVVVNLAVAGMLFVVVFRAGIERPAPVVGWVAEGQPAAKAVAVNAEALGLTGQGLKPGDEILRIGGAEPRSFFDVMVATGMARADDPVAIAVRRQGVDGDLEFQVTPERSQVRRMGLQIGAGPAVTTTVSDPADPGDRAELQRRLGAIGLAGVSPGARLVEVNGAPIEHFWDAAGHFDAGVPVEVVFASDGGTRTAYTMEPPLRSVLVAVQDDGDRVVRRPVQHALGLTPPARVQNVVPGSAAEIAGLEPGDILMRIGSVEWPGAGAAIREIRAHTGRAVQITVLRDREPVRTHGEVSSKGVLGFGIAPAIGSPSIITRPVTDGASLAAPPGSFVVGVDGVAVSDFAQLRAALRLATAGEYSRNEGAVVAFKAATRAAGEGGWIRGLGPDDASRRTGAGGGLGVETIEWELSPERVASLHEGWASPLDAGFFTPLDVTLRAGSTAEALSMGLHETRRTIATVYLTLRRLIEGSVKVEQLSGPVGITHIGSSVAERGLVQLLFFLALISANLAVINFLPLPIVDGGLFLFALVELVARRPVPVVVQNLLAMAGMIGIVCIFVLLTYHDVLTLLGI